jgi:hypothetical protein
MVTNRTGMEIGIVTTTVGLASEKDGSRGKDNNGFQLPNYQSIFFFAQRGLASPRSALRDISYRGTTNPNRRRLSD